MIRTLLAWTVAAAMYGGPLGAHGYAQADAPGGQAPTVEATSEARRAIESVLAAMEEAVVAGDADAYLEHVAPDDAVFLTEQTHWAADLKTHVPEAFDLSIADVRSHDGRIEGDLTIAWSMPGAGDRQVRFRAAFVPDGGAYDFTGPVWRRLEGEDVLVLYAEGLEPLARRIVNAFPGVRAHVEEGFALHVPGSVQVKLYDSMERLQESIYLSYSDALAGWNEPGEAIKVLASGPIPDASLDALLAHEFAHVATFEMGDKATDAPWWVLEGVADLAAERFTGDRHAVDNLVRRWAAQGNLAAWSKLADFRSTPAHLMWHVYRQGRHMVGYISERFGREGRNEWLRLMANGATLDEATRQALGVAFDELDVQWRASLTDR